MGRLVRSRAKHFNRIAKKAKLTEAQKNVAAYAIEGLTNQEVAKKLGISSVTVGVHLTAVYKKTGVRTRQELQWLMHKGKKTTKKAPRRKTSKKLKHKKAKKRRKPKLASCRDCAKRLQPTWRYCPTCGIKL